MDSNSKQEEFNSLELENNVLNQKNPELENQNTSVNGDINISDLSKSLERLADYFPSIRNEEAMTLYNRALETNSKEDILSAINSANNLEDSEVIKKNLKDALIENLTNIAIKNNIDIEKEQKKEKASKDLEREIESIKRLASYFPDMNNEEAMILYNKALETNSKEDILSAINSANNLEDSEVTKKNLKDALIGALTSIAIKNNIDIEKEQKKEKASKDLEREIESIKRLASYFPDMNNEEAMILYNKALETHEKEDIINAMETVDKLDNGKMYKQALATVINTMAEVYDINIEEEKNKREAIRELEDANKAIGRLNSFVVNEEIKNNSAMPFYNKALETHKKEDINNAMEAVNKLENGHMYKQALTQAINAMAKVYDNKINENNLNNNENNSKNKQSNEELIVEHSDQPTISQETDNLEQPNIEPVVEEPSIVDNSVLNTQLLEEKKKLEIQLSIIDKYINGEIDDKGNKTESFDSQISKLQQQISQINLQNSETVTLDPKEEFAKATENLEKLLITNEQNTTKEENKAIELYYDAISIPTAENVVSALNNASFLPENSNIKNSLIDAIVKFEASHFKETDEINMIRDKMRELNIKPFESQAITNSENDIAGLIQKIEEIKKEKLDRKEKLEDKKSNINKLISDIDEKLKDFDNSNNKTDEKSNNNPEKIEADIENDIPPTFAEEEKINKNLFDRIKDKIDSKKTVDAEQQQYIDDLAKYADKLHQIGEEGRIFSDENRIEKENSWMEEKTAQALGKYNNEDIEINSVENKENTDIANPIINTENEHKAEDEKQDDLPPTFAEESEDKFKLPHPIKAIKKASRTLIDKVNTEEFNNKKKAVLDYLKKAKLAVATTAVLLGLGLASSIINNNSSKVDAKNDPNEVSQIEDVGSSINDKMEEIGENITAQQVATEESKDSSLKYDTLLAEEIQKIQNGEASVYTSFDRAVNQVDPKTPTASQIDNSWKEAQPGAYYDAEGNKISETDAMNMVESGEQVAARMDNDRGTAGYINIGGNTEENTQGMSR